MKQKKQVLETIKDSLNNDPNDWHFYECSSANYYQSIVIRHNLIFASTDDPVYLKFNIWDSIKLRRCIRNASAAKAFNRLKTKQ